MWGIFNYSIKKLSNFKSSFSNSDTSRKKEHPTISTKTLRMKIHLSKTFLQTQSLFIVWNQKETIFFLGKTGSRERKLLTLKGLARLLPRIQNLYQISYILWNPLWYLLVQSSDTNLLAAKETLGLRCICRNQLVIQTTHLNCHLACDYVTSFLAYCRG